MLEDTTNIHNAISTAIREDEGLRTHIRESSSPAVLTPPPPRVGRPSHTDMASFTVIPRLVDRPRGDDIARHTDKVIMEDTQGSPSDTAGVQRMDIEDNPVQDQHPSVSMGDVHMEVLDLGGEDDTEHIQQTQASQAARADDIMETEAPVAVEITKAHLLIAEEGVVVYSNAAALPLDDEVTHL